MKILNKLLMIPASMLLLTSVTSCNNGDIVSELKDVQSTFLLFDYDHAVINNTISFTVEGDVEVDWGDGTLSKETTHKYYGPSDYIRIIGNVKSIEIVDDEYNGNEAITGIIFPATISTIATNSIILPELSIVYLPTSISRIEEYAFESTEDIQFFAGASSKPDGWSEHWARTEYFKDKINYGTHIGYGDGNLCVCIESGAYAILLSSLSQSETLTIPDVVKLDGKSYQIKCLAKYTFFSEEYRTVILPRYLIEIPNYCFEDAYVNKIDFSRTANLISIGEFAFVRSNIQELYIPKTVQFIGRSIVSGTSWLRKITVDPANPYFHSPENSNVIMKGTKVVAGCATSIIPEETTVIGHYAFDYVPYLKEIKLPKNVKELEYASFWFCSNLETVDATAFTDKDDISNCNKTAFQNNPSFKTVYCDASLSKNDFIAKGWPDNVNYTQKESL